MLRRFVCFVLGNYYAFLLLCGLLDIACVLLKRLLGISIQPNIIRLLALLVLAVVLFYKDTLEVWFMPTFRNKIRLDSHNSDRYLELMHIRVDGTAVYRLVTPTVTSYSPYMITYGNGSIFLNGHVGRFKVLELIDLDGQLLITLGV